MYYNVSDLCSAYERGENFKYLFFWSDKPKNNNIIGANCLSQWWISPFVIEVIEYKSAEHWMMAEKARLFNDKLTLEKILKADSPALVKKLGREIENFNDDIWIKNRFEIVVKGNYHKFSQNTDLKNYLINTKNRVLAEASPVDNIWGIGMSADNKDVENPYCWNGLNLLGFAIMKARDKIISNHD